MKLSKRPMFSLELASATKSSVLHFLEPVDTSLASLLERLIEGRYAKPFIVDTGRRRALQFDLNCEQSVMLRHDPYRLALTYTRKMMAFLLFNSEPRRVLMLGLGGGSLAKFCHRHLPQTALTAVEINPDVIALREQFRIPSDDDRFRIICEDAAAYLAALRRCKDVILVDACDRTGIAPELNSLEFYHHAWRSLSRRGVFVANICGEPYDRAAHLTRIRTVFGQDVVALRGKQEDNVVVFAFKKRAPFTEWERLERIALKLKRQLGLDFPRYARRIALQCRGWKGQSLGI
jgi:spermidine synthase